MSAEDADDIEAEIERLKADSRTRDGFARVLASLADVQEMGFNGVRQHVHAPVGAGTSTASRGVDVVCSTPMLSRSGRASMSLGFVRRMNTLGNTQGWRNV